MVWMTSCSKSAEPTAAGAPDGAPVAAGAAKPADGAAPADAGAKPAAGSELEALKGKVSALKSYEMNMTMQGQTMSIKAVLKDGKPQKMRMDNAQMGGWMVYDLSTKTMYMVNEQKKEAMKMTLTDEQTKDMPDNVGESIDMVIKQNPKLSSEKIDGVDCWKAITGEGKEQATVWFSKEHGLPLQVQSPAQPGPDGSPAKGGEQIIKMNYTNINKVADKDFELPKGLKITDMGDMMKNMKDKAK